MPKKRANTEMTTKVIREAYKHYTDGETLEAVGKRYDITRQTMYYYFKAMNLPRRTNGESWKITKSKRYGYARQGRT